MRCSVTGSIEPPYPSGFDDCDFHNKMKEWFKHEGLLEHFKRGYDAKKEQEEYLSNDLETSDFEISENQASIVINFLEDKIRSELYEYVEQLEDSREEIKAFIEGMDYAIRQWQNKND